VRRSPGRNAKHCVELARQVLEGDQSRQFDDRVIAKMSAQGGDMYLAGPLPRQRHCLGICERGAFMLVEKTAIAPGPQRRDLLKAGVALKQSRRVEIDAKGAIVDL